MPPVRSKMGDADFVNDYVAKKQAQMQRAREIREERSKRSEEKQRQLEQQQQQQQQQEEEEEEELHQGEFVTQETMMRQEHQNDEEKLLQHNAKKPKVQSKSSAAGHKERCILQVVEEDFTKATQAGIITPDQARQLWAMFSDQVIRVVPGEPHVNSTVSIESLLTLSNHTSASATTSSLNSADAFNSLNYNNTTHSNHSSGSNTNNSASTGFGGSISLESLRQSIANFKKEQKRKGKNATSKMHGNNKATNNNNFDNKTNDNDNNSESDESDKDSNANVNQKQDLYKNNESGDGADDNEAYFNTGEYLRSLDKRNDEINTKRSTSSNNNTNKKKIRKQPMRPEWNYDVGVANAQHEEEEEQHVSGQAGLNTNSTGVKPKQEKNATNVGKDVSVGQRNNKKTNQAISNSNNATGALKGKSTASERKNDIVTSKQNAQYNVQEDKLSSMVTPTNNNTNSKNRSNASNNTSRFSSSKNSAGTVVNLDDIPVGKAVSEAINSNYGNNSNLFANWDNAFPVTSQGDAKHNFLTSSPPSSSAKAAAGNNKSVNGLSNELIEHEASVAAQEPLRECGTCGRSFRVSVLNRHEAVCRKQANKKRIAFDMQSQRLDGVEGMNEVRRTTDAFGKNWAKKMNNTSNNTNNNGNGNANNNNNKTSAQKMPKWKIEHEQFQAAMRAAHMQSALESGSNNNSTNYMFGKNNTSALPPPPPPLPPELDNRVLCPHCGRKFAEETAARHIPKCATTIAKPKGIRPIRR